MVSNWLWGYFKYIVAFWWCVSYLWERGLWGWRCNSNSLFNNIKKRTFIFYKEVVRLFIHIIYDIKSRYTSYLFIFILIQDKFRHKISIWCTIAIYCYISILFFKTFDYCGILMVKRSFSVIIVIEPHNSVYSCCIAY